MNIKESKLFIKAADLANKSPLLQGVHGIGKSDIVHQYAVDNNLHCETLILSLMDVGDLLGLPRTIEVGGQLTTTWSAPDWFCRVVDAAFPTSVNFEDLVFNDSKFEKYVVSMRSNTATIDREFLNTLYCNFTNTSNDHLYITNQTLVTYTKARRSVIFLDEFNRAPSDILNASLQLVLDKRLHSHILPVINNQPTFVVAAINPADADYTVSSFDPALLDRFIYGVVEPDAKAWLDDYARPKNLSQVVRDYIAEHPTKIHYTPADNSVGATPRSWSALADVVAIIDQIPAEIHFQVFKGCVGTELAAQFLSYFNNYSKVVKLEDIEKLVKTKSARTKDVEKIAVHVNKLIASQEAIQKTELAENLFTKYIGKDTPEEALPLLAYLYAIDLEVLAAFLKDKKEADTTTYMKLAALDATLNNKGLFKKITTKLSK